MPLAPETTTPFAHLLVALDGSRLAESALPAAAAVAAPLGARVTLLHLIEEGAPAAVHGEPHLKDPAAAEAYLADVASRAFPAGTDVEWHVHVEAEESVAQGLVDHARELGADLVVMCSHGHGGLRQRIVGSIAQRVIALGELPVLLVPPAAIGRMAEMALRMILVPLDGNTAHEAGLEVAAGLASRAGADLELLSIVPTLTTLDGERAATGLLLPNTMSALLDFAEEGARSYLLRLAEALGRRGVGVAVEVVRGDPAGQIVDAATGADLVVLATHGRSGLSAFWEGSVSAHVASRASSPLLLIPAL